MNPTSRGRSPKKKAAPAEGGRDGGRLATHALYTDDRRPSMGGADVKEF